jgi:Peptidase family M23/Transglycosylase SLT domain/NlpC/P60 family
MKKIAALLGPIVVMIMMVPFLAALMVTAIASPAAGQELKAIVCAGPMPASGSWRPPFQQGYALTSGFGMRFDPVNHQWKLHTGQDLVSQPSPGPVVAAASGKVVSAGALAGYGNTVVLQHSGGVRTLYGHLASIDAKIAPGRAVATGQVLGAEGSTGASTGNHLHFEVIVGAKPIDPVPFMVEHGAPLNGKSVAASPSQGTTPAMPNGEGGIGFPLPAPGTPRGASLTNPPLPIPAQIKNLYVGAASRYQVPWTLLAGIGMEESGHGRNNTASSAGALGLMQFMPATWASMGVDGNGDGRADIRGDADSIYSAANYLTKSGVTKGPDGVRSAIFTYNHADWYVNDALYYAKAYGGGIVLGDPSDCGAGSGNANLPPLTNERVKTVLTWAQGHVGDPYVFGANGPNAWDCSSFTQAAYARINITMPRTAGAQRGWLAAGNGFRVQLGAEKPGDLIFSDSYLGPNAIGHVAMVWDPARRTTIEALDTANGVGHFSYAGGPSRHIFEIWRVGNVADIPSRTA